VQNLATDGYAWQKHKRQLTHTTKSNYTHCQSVCEWCDCGCGCVHVGKFTLPRLSQ